MNLSPKERENLRYENVMGITIQETACPNCDEPSEKEYETFCVRGQELCVHCNSKIEPYYDGVTDNGFVDINHELHLSYNPLL